ncbi:MAG: SHOCT domain-containing protein [Clostridiales bacterium]|nr:SHOCT domain-containing protein [Clostridiales bacterium]
MAHMTSAERIREYKQLLDEGMITQEEFELKKQKILEMDEAAEDAAQDAAEEAPKNDGVFSGHYFQDKANNGQQEQDQNAKQNQNQSSSGSISTKATGVLAYITWIGFLIAYFAGDRQGARFHLNQGLVVNLFGLLSAVPLVGKIWSVFILICAIIGIINASNGENKEVPLIGGIKLL